MEVDLPSPLPVEDEEEKVEVEVKEFAYTTHCTPYSLKMLPVVCQAIIGQYRRNFVVQKILQKEREVELQRLNILIQTLFDDVNVGI